MAGGEYEELLCILDPERLAECDDMLDDWIARLGVPEELADALRESIADDWRIRNRG
jgi:hypothetical protein